MFLNTLSDNNAFLPKIAYPILNRTFFVPNSWHDIKLHQSTSST